MVLLTASMYFFRDKLSLKLKSRTILLFLFLNGVINLYFLGLLSMGITNLLLLVVIAALLTDRKTWISLMVLTSITVIIYALLFTKGIISVTIDPEAYSIAKSTWTVQIMGLVSYQLIVAFSINYLMTSLIKAHNEKEELIMNENERLEILVNDRTKQLEQTMHELIQNERIATLGSLVIGISHEVNTPLGASLSTATFLSTKSDELLLAYNTNQLSKSDLSKYIQIIHESTDLISNGLEKAVSSMNKFKNISIQQDQVIVKKFELCEIIRLTISNLQSESILTSHEIDLQCEEEIWVQSDPRLFMQIINHLISNSVIHAFFDDTKGKISLQVQLTSETLRIICEDNGVGISKERSEHIFEPFYKHDISKGSGLGLSIVYNVVTDLLNGSIDLDSNYKNGSRFIINIPINSLENQRE